MKLLKQSKGLTAALSMGCAMSIAVQSTLAYIFTQTEPAHNIFQPYTPVEGDLLITKKVYHPYGDSYTIPDNIAFDFQVDLGGFYANYTFTTSKGLIKADENGILSLKVKPDESVAISGIEDGTTAEITEIQQDSDGFELDGNEIRSVKVSAEKLNEIEFVNVYSPEPAAADITVTAEKLLDGRDWQEGDSFELLFERGSPDEWIKLDSAVVEYGGENKVDFTEAMKAMEFSALGDYVFRLTETEGDIENIIYDDTENTFTVSVTDNDMDGYLEISKISAENNAVLTTGDDGTYDINVTFTNIYEPPVTTETTTTTIITTKPTTTTSTSTITTTEPTTTTSTSTVTTTKPTTTTTTTSTVTTTETTSTSTVTTTKPTTTTSTVTTTEPITTTSTSTVTTTEPTTTTSTSTVTTTKPITTTSTSTVTTTELTTTSSTSTVTTTKPTTTEPTTTVADGAVTWDIEDKNIPYSDNDQTVTVAVVITNGEKPLPIAGGKFTIVTSDGLVLEAVTGSDAYGGDIFGDGIYDEFAFTSADGKGIAPADGTLAFELLVTIPGGTDPGRYNIDIGSCVIYDENGNDITDKLTIVGGSITILPRVTTTTEPTTTTSTSTVTTTKPTTTTSTSTVTTTKPTTTTSTSTVTTTKPTTTTSTSTVSTTKPTTTTSTSTVTTTKPTTTTSTSTITTTKPTTTTEPTTTVADGAVTWDIEDKNIPYSDNDQTVTVAVIIKNGEAPLPVSGGKFTIVTSDGLVLEAVTSSTGYGGTVTENDSGEFTFTTDDGLNVSPENGDIAFELIITVPGGTEPGEYDINIDECQIFDEDGNDITNRVAVMNGAIIILPTVEPTINSYIVIEKPELGNYFSHDNRTYDKSKLGKVYRVYVDENGEEIDREDVTDDIDFNGNTPADTYRESNTSFRYEVPIYLEGELMMDENGEISTAVAYIGVKGDVNLDNHANAIDATLILAYYAKMQTGESSENTVLCHDDPYLDNLGAFLGDVDTNEYSPMNQATHKNVRKLDASDTSFILSYYAVTQTSYDPVPREIWKQVVGVDNIIDE